MQIVYDKPKVIYIYGSTGVSSKILLKFIEKWHKERVKNNIFLKIVYADTEDSRKRVAKYKNNDLVDVRFMPAGYESPVATFLFFIFKF